MTELSALLQRLRVLLQGGEIYKGRPFLNMGRVVRRPGQPEYMTKVYIRAAGYALGV